VAPGSPRQACGGRITNYLNQLYFSTIHISSFQHGLPALLVMISGMHGIYVRGLYNSPGLQQAIGHLAATNNRMSVQDGMKTGLVIIPSFMYCGSVLQEKVIFCLQRGKTGQDPR